MRFAHGYYDLHVKFPAVSISITPDATLTLQIKGPSTFTVAAQVYGKSGVPELQITRK
jgi:hypothetical protein